MKPVLIRVLRHAAIATAFIVAAVMFRGWFIERVGLTNPDEAELMAQARAALRSPVPFTTWTTTTTGPFWVLFLALLGAIGLPLTMAFAHVLAAVLTGVLGYLGFVLASRSLGASMSLVLTLFWWLPIVFVLASSWVDFGPLATELLPCVLILGSALFRTESLARHPGLLFVVGLLGGLAVGSKYQAAPVVLAVLVAHLILIGTFELRSILRRVLIWAAGCALPLVIVGLAMLLSSDVSTTAIQQNLNFLEVYGNLLTPGQRLTNWRNLVTQMHIVLLVLSVAWLGTRSVPKIQVCRAGYVAAGLAAVLIGGMPFGHYLHFVYTGIALAIGLPVMPGVQLVPYVRRRLDATAVIAVIAVIGWIMSFGLSVGFAQRTHRKDLFTAFSPTPVNVNPQMRAACPAGSNVVIWGWAPELYVDNSWRNAIPFMNVTQLIYSPKNYATGYELVSRAVSDSETDCVVDAIGKPFFGMRPDWSLSQHYPDLKAVLDRDYHRVEGLIDCEACTVYVRR